MAATTASSVTAAREATEDALRQLGENRPAGALMFDFVATRLRLGNVALAGCNTYGQVASAERQFGGFHNCTAVICVSPE
jgi:hypothetical protein